MLNVPRQPKSRPKSRSGQKKYEGAASPKSGIKRAGAKPVEEEDIFGGAERTGNEDVTSKNAKP